MNIFEEVCKRDYTEDGLINIRGMITFEEVCKKNSYTEEELIEMGATETGLGSYRLLAAYKNEGISFGLSRKNRRKYIDDRPLDLLFKKNSDGLFEEKKSGRNRYYVFPKSIFGNKTKATA